MHMIDFQARSDLKVLGCFFWGYVIFNSFMLLAILLFAGGIIR
jgi:hypothetical protein